MAEQSAKTRTGERVVVVDRVACKGHGSCAQLLAGSMHLDEWGYPIESRVPAHPEVADAVVRLCPARAIRALDR